MKFNRYFLICFYVYLVYLFGSVYQILSPNTLFPENSEGYSTFKPIFIFTFLFILITWPVLSLLYKSSSGFVRSLLLLSSPISIVILLTTRSSILGVNSFLNYFQPEIFTTNIFFIFTLTLLYFLIDRDT
jgi:hypothetical protein